MRVKAVVAYDGTNYSGFQRQANAFTIQEALEVTLAQVTQETINIIAAGRTDAGVHAKGQVIAFDTAWRHEIGDLQRAMNAVLPEDIAVRELEVAELDFHPRYDARSRWYQYTFYNTPVRCPLVDRYSLHVSKPLDVAAMQQAAQYLVGEQDFATFGQPPQGNVTVRNLFRASWNEHPYDYGLRRQERGSQQGLWLTFDIEANAFLYRMVRSIVGTLLQVGWKRISVKEFVAALKACDRSQAGTTAPAHGLCLIKVNY